MKKVQFFKGKGYCLHKSCHGIENFSSYLNSIYYNFREIYYNNPYVRIVPERFLTIQLSILRPFQAFCSQEIFVQSNLRIFAELTLHKWFRSIGCTQNSIHSPPSRAIAAMNFQSGNYCLALPVVLYLA